MKFFKFRQSKQGRQPHSSGSAPVFSYYASRSKTAQYQERGRRVPDSGKQPGRKPWRLSWHRMPYLVAAFAIAYSLLYVLWIDTNPRITIVAVADQPTILQSTEVYQNAGQELLRHSPTNRFKLTVDTTGVARDLKDKFPELANVSITVPLVARRLLFKVQPVTPVLVITSRLGGVFVIDERGRAVVQASNVLALDSLNLPLVVDESGLEIEKGQAVLPQEDVRFIDNLLYQLEATGLNTASLNLPQVANELHVRLKDQSYFVKFNMAGDARVQAGTLFAVQKRLAAEGRVPAEYIDVRVEERAFYK